MGSYLLIQFDSYADIINSERLPAQIHTDTSSGSSLAPFSLSGPSSSASAAQSLQLLSPASDSFPSPFSPASAISSQARRTRRGYHPDRADSSETVTYARLKGQSDRDIASEVDAASTAGGWGVLELGKSLAGSAAGLLSSVGISGNDEGLEGLAIGGISAEDDARAGQSTISDRTVTS